MTLESDVAALSARTLWLRARDISASSGTIGAWRSYDGSFAATISFGTPSSTMTTSEKPPLATKSVSFSGINGMVIGQTAPKGIVSVFASSTFSGFYPEAVFDGVASSGVTEWATNSTTSGHIGAQYATGFAATGYTLWARGSTAANQAPKDWTFEGSNNGSSWTTLDTRTGQTVTSGSNYTFSNSTSYTYYRLNVTAVQTGGGAVGLGKMEITGAPTVTIHSGTSGEVWGVIKSTTGERPGWGKTGGGTTPYYPYTDGNVYYEHGSSSRPSFTPTESVTAWHIVRYKKAADGTMSAYINNVSQHSSNTGGAAWAPIIYIGQGLISATTPSLHMAEWISFSSALSDADATTVYNYLTETHFTAGSPTASLSGTGTITTAGAVGKVTGATLSGTGSIVAGAGAVTTAALAGTGAITTAGVVAKSTGATLAGTGTITAAAAGVLTGTATRSGTGTITAVGQVTPTLGPWEDGASGEALLNLEPAAGVLEVTYPADTPPSSIVEVSLQRASHQMPVLSGVRAMDYDIVTDVVGTPHVWVDGVDVTYFRDIPTKIAGWRQEAPFGWTSTSLTFPQVFHWEERGTGDLTWMVADAPVEIAIVTPLGARLHRFTGHLASEDPGVGRGRTECVWGVEGALWQADHSIHPVPARLDPTDIGTLIPDELNGTPARRFSPISRVVTGIPSRQRGSTQQTRWGYATDQLATATVDGGDQWTIEPTGPRSFALVLKDTTTVHWTVTAGAPGVELDLSHDHHERIDAVYGRGIGPDGYAWRNVFFPDLLPYDPPAYPYADPDQNVLLGDTDAMTLTGTGISDWQRRIRELGYTTLPVDGVMGDEDIAAVRWIQRRMGIEVDGFMAGQTWAASWNVGAVGGDLRTIRLPLAVRPEVEEFIYAANGAIVGTNPAYDPSIIRHEIDVDFGAGVTKSQGREMALRILERGLDPGIVGTVKLMTCPWEGSRWEMDAGDNVLIKGFRGEDVLCRITALDADPEALTVTLTVDSEFRDAMAVVEILNRNRDSRPDPARRPGNPNRRSRMDQDQVTPFEGESPAGRLPKLPLYEGHWTVWPVPVSEVGLIAKLRVTTSGPVTKFAVSLWAKPITANQIAAKVPDPLALSNPWESAGDAWLDSMGFVEGWGEEGDAAGYGMLGRESEGSTLTGVLYDDAGVPFVSQKSPWLWVALYSPVSCFIEGRIYPEPTQ